MGKSAGNGINHSELEKYLKDKNFKNFQLIKGDITRQFKIYKKIKTKNCITAFRYGCLRYQMCVRLSCRQSC